MTSKRRWWVYGLIGLLFGVADWYYLDGLAHFPWGGLANSALVVPLLIALNYGIWLLPVVPVTWHESRVSGKARSSAVAGALCWVSSIFGYYLFYTLLLAFWGLPNMEQYLVLGEKQPGFWQEWNVVFQKIIVDQVLEWLPLAMIGGAIVGLAVGWFNHRKRSAA